MTQGELDAMTTTTKITEFKGQTIETKCVSEEAGEDFAGIFFFLNYRRYNTLAGAKAAVNRGIKNAKNGTGWTGLHIK